MSFALPLPLPLSAMGHGGLSGSSFVRSGAFDHFHHPLTSKSFEQKVKSDVAKGRRSEREQPVFAVKQLIASSATSTAGATFRRNATGGSSSTLLQQQQSGSQSARAAPNSHATGRSTAAPPLAPVSDTSASRSAPPAPPALAATAGSSVRRRRRLKAARPIRRPNWSVDYYLNTDIVATDDEKKRGEDVLLKDPSVRDDDDIKLLAVYLTTIAFFARLPQFLVLELARVCRVRVYGRNAVIYRIGDDAEHMFVIASGRVATRMKPIVLTDGGGGVVTSTVEETVVPDAAGGGGVTSTRRVHGHHRAAVGQSGVFTATGVPVFSTGTTAGVTTMGARATYAAQRKARELALAHEQLLETGTEQLAASAEAAAVAVAVSAVGGNDFGIGREIEEEEEEDEEDEHRHNERKRKLLADGDGDADGSGADDFDDDSDDDDSAGSASGSDAFTDSDDERHTRAARGGDDHKSGSRLSHRSNASNHSGGSGQRAAAAAAAAARGTPASSEHSEQQRQRRRRRRRQQRRKQSGDAAAGTGSLPSTHRNGTTSLSADDEERALKAKQKRAAWKAMFDTLNKVRRVATSYPVNVQRAGESFGEAALHLTHSRRTHTKISLEPRTSLITIRSADYREIVHKAMSGVTREHALFLRTTRSLGWWFDACTDDELWDLSRRITRITVPKGQVICKQDEVVDGGLESKMWIIYSGECRVVQRIQNHVSAQQSQQQTPQQRSNLLLLSPAPALKHHRTAAPAPATTAAATSATHTHTNNKLPTLPLAQLQAAMNAATTNNNTSSQSQTARAATGGDTTRRSMSISSSASSAAASTANGGASNSILLDLGRLRAGSMFGELALLAEQHSSGGAAAYPRRTASVYTDTPCVLLVLTKNDITGRGSALPDCAIQSLREYGDIYPSHNALRSHLEQTATWNRFKAKIVGRIQPSRRQPASTATQAVPFHF